MNTHHMLQIAAFCLLGQACVPSPSPPQETRPTVGSNETWNKPTPPGRNSPSSKRVKASTPTKSPDARAKKEAKLSRTGSANQARSSRIATRLRQLQKVQLQIYSLYQACSQEHYRSLRSSTKRNKHRSQAQRRALRRKRQPSPLTLRLLQRGFAMLASKSLSLYQLRRVFRVTQSYRDNGWWVEERSLGFGVKKVAYNKRTGHLSVSWSGLFWRGRPLEVTYLASSTRAFPAPFLNVASKTPGYRHSHYRMDQQTHWNVGGTREARHRKRKLRVFLNSKLGQAPTLKSNNKCYTRALSPHHELNIGTQCGITSQGNRTTNSCFRGLVRQKKKRILQALLRGLNPEARWFAAFGLIVLAAQQKQPLAAHDRKAILALEQQDGYLKTCSGCMGGYVLHSCYFRLLRHFRTFQEATKIRRMWDNMTQHSMYLLRTP